MEVAANEANVHHLLTRAAWVATDEDVAAGVAAGIERTVADLLEAPTPAAPVPEQLNGGDDEIVYDPLVVAQWFLGLAVESSAPALERLTWFWHGHFATNVEKVEFPSLSHQQLLTLREHARGDLQTLVTAMTFDPAMILWLDLETNVVGTPNENYARELLELFTMGIDNGYTQRDIVELARALTGVGLDWAEEERPRRSRFQRDAHDDGVKTILGSTARHDPHSAIDVIVQRPETAAFIARRLWHRYAGTTITPAASRDIAAALRQDRSITSALATMLTHPDFYSDEVRNGLVAAPVESIVRAARGFGLTIRPPRQHGEELQLDPIVEMAEVGGQMPIHPPHVGGWPHNEAWLDLTGAQRRVAMGRVLGFRILDDPADRARRVVDARTNHQLHDALAAGLGVRRWSPQTAAALDETARISNTEERIVAAVTVAFSSPEVTLS